MRGIARIDVAETRIKTGALHHIFARNCTCAGPDRFDKIREPFYVRGCSAMKLPIYQVDAFTGEIFKGNYAAVVPLERWLPDELMQSIATENNVSETAFFVRNPEGIYDIRWF